MGRFHFLTTFFVAVCIVLFQNCSPQSNSSHDGSKKPNFSLEAGDTGYEGKVSYGSRTHEERCLDGSDIHSKIEINRNLNKVQLTRDNCQDINPVNIAMEQLDLLPHNLENIPEDKRVYEKYKDKLPPGKIFAFCRGQARNQDIEPVVVDVIVKDMGDKKYLARVVAGKYNAEGVLIGTRDSGFVSVYRWATEKAPDTAYFTYKNGKGEREWFIKVRSGTETLGSLEYDKIEENSWGSIWNYPCYRFIQ